jgi:uncharacterized protein YdeI (YjbR/CyaY-like superfamily)
LRGAGDAAIIGGMKRDERIDAYIGRQAEFAKPILEHLRAAVHAACPEAEETLKWSAPAFMYKGEILAMMAGFKAHVAFNLWRGGQVVEEGKRQSGAMGQFGRIASIEDLPDPEALAQIIHKAMALVDAGVKPQREKKAKPAIEPPGDLLAALAANEAALATFEGFSPSCRREYVEWVVEAKRAETRSGRIAQAVEWMAEGKKRNWKYEKC